jgi:D-alanyl-D-alanine carboxypeptidase
MASVGKLFTATIIGMLKDDGVLDFDDYAYKHLDEGVIDRIHVLKGVDYSKTITIRHLLMHTSGLSDVFWDLLKNLNDQETVRSPKELINYVKANTEAKFIPGKKVSYADTNYYILGQVIEHVTGKVFHEVVHETLFIPLKMNRSYLLSQSEPSNGTMDVAPFRIGGINGLDYPTYGWIDYAGGSVTGPLDDFNIFMKAFSENRILIEATTQEMVETNKFMYPMIRYGMGVWVLKSPLFDFSNHKYAYGVFGATGAFLVYHPKTRSVISGSFNDDAFKIESVRFVMKVIRELLKV